MPSGQIHKSSKSISDLSKNKKGLFAQNISLPNLTNNNKIELENKKSSIIEKYMNSDSENEDEIAVVAKKTPLGFGKMLS